MSIPIVEQIAENIRATINGITTGAGYNQTLTAIRPKRVDYQNPPWGNNWVIIEQGNRGKGDAAHGSEVWYQDFTLSALVIDSDTIAAVAQVSRFTVGGTIEATDKFILTVSSGTGSLAVLTVVAGSTVAATVAATIAAAWNASADPLLTPITASNADADVILTADVAGIPFTVTPSTTESTGDPSDGQTFAVSATAGTDAVNASVDTRINQVAADIEKALKIDTSRGGWARGDTIFGEMRPLYDNQGRTSGLEMTVRVLYRTQYADPFTII